MIDEIEQIDPDELQEQYRAFIEDHPEMFTPDELMEWGMDHLLDYWEDD